ATSGPELRQRWLLRRVRSPSVSGCRATPCTDLAATFALSWRLRAEPGVTTRRAAQSSSQLVSRRPCSRGDTQVASRTQVPRRVRSSRGHERARSVCSGASGAPGVVGGAWDHLDENLLSPVPS